MSWRTLGKLIVAITIVASIQLPGFNNTESVSAQVEHDNCQVTVIHVPGASAELYWEEWDSNRSRSKTPELWLKTSVHGNESFRRVMSATEMGARELACWTHTDIQYWSQIPYGWKYNGRLDYANLFAGLFVPDGTHQLDHYYGLPGFWTKEFSWYPVSPFDPNVGRKLTYAPITLCSFSHAEELIGNEVGAPGHWRRLEPNNLQMESDKKERLELKNPGLRLDHTAEGVHTFPGDGPIHVKGASLWCLN